MFLEVIAIILLICIYVLPFIIWPIFISMGVNASNKILDENDEL